MSVFRLVLSSLCAFGGYSAFICFIILDNYPSAVLSFTVGITESISTFLHYLYLKRRIHDYYTPRELRQIGRFGITLLFIGIVLCIYYTTMEALTKKPIMPIPTSLVLPLIWTTIIIRSAVVLIYYTRKYKTPSGYEPIQGEDAESSINHESTEIEHDHVTQVLPRIEEESIPQFQPKTNPIAENSNKNNYFSSDESKIMQNTDIEVLVNTEDQLNGDPYPKINENNTLDIEPTLLVENKDVQGSENVVSVPINESMPSIQTEEVEKSEENSNNSEEVPNVLNETENKNEESLPKENNMTDDTKIESFLTEERNDQ